MSVVAPPDGDARPPSEEALAWVDERSRPADGSVERLYQTQLARRDRLGGEIDDAKARERRLALYREAAGLLDRDGLRYTFTTNSEEAGYLVADSDVEVLWHEMPVYWYESEQERQELDELGLEGYIVALWTVARWTAPTRPRRERMPSTPYPFTPVVVRLARALMEYPDANAVVLPHLLMLRRREGALEVIEQLAAAEQSRQADLKQQADEVDERVRAAWWRSENPLPVLLQEGSADESKGQGATQNASLPSSAPLDVALLKRDADYVRRVVADWVHTRQVRTISAAFERLKLVVGNDGVGLVYQTEDALREALRRRGGTKDNLMRLGAKGLD